MAEYSSSYTGYLRAGDLEEAHFCLLSVYDSYIRGPLLNTKKTGCTRGCSVCHASRHYVSLGVDLNELLLRDGGAQAMGTTGMMTRLSHLAMGDVYVSEPGKHRTMVLHDGNLAPVSEKLLENPYKNL